MTKYFGGTPVRQDSKAQIALFLSFFFLLLFAALAYRILTHSTSTPATTAAVVIQEELPQVTMIDVVVPLRQIEAGQQLNPAMFKIDRRPKMGLDYGIVNDLELVSGYYASTLLVPGQPLALAALSKIQPVSAISSKIPPGFRAVSIHVNATSAVEGWARPGSRVDVDWLSKINGQSGVTTIVHNAEVLSADRQSAVNPNSPDVAIPHTVTLLVTTGDARAIKLAQSAGVLELVLRGDNDSGKVEEGGSITVDDLLQGSRTKNVRDQRKGGTLIMDGKKYLVEKNGSLSPLPEK